MVQRLHESCRNHGGRWRVGRGKGGGRREGGGRRWGEQGRGGDSHESWNSFHRLHSNFVTARTHCVLGCCGLAHAALSYGMSSYYRSLRKCRWGYCRWHVIWHTAFPLWASLFGLWENTITEDVLRAEGRERWYPNVALSFFGPLAVLVGLIWASRPPNKACDEEQGRLNSSRDQIISRRAHTLLTETGCGDSPIDRPRKEN